MHDTHSDTHSGTAQKNVSGITQAFARDMILDNV